MTSKEIMDELRLMDVEWIKKTVKPLYKRILNEVVDSRKEKRWSSRINNYVCKRARSYLYKELRYHQQIAFKQTSQFKSKTRSERVRLSWKPMGLGGYLPFFIEEILPAKTNHFEDYKTSLATIMSREEVEALINEWWADAVSTIPQPKYSQEEEEEREPKMFKMMLPKKRKPNFSGLKT